MHCPLSIATKKVSTCARMSNYHCGITIAVHLQIAKSLRRTISSLARYYSPSRVHIRLDRDNLRSDKDQVGWAFEDSRVHTALTQLREIATNNVQQKQKKTKSKLLGYIENKDVNLFGFKNPCPIRHALRFNPSQVSNGRCRKRNSQKLCSCLIQKVHSFNLARINLML